MVATLNYIDVQRFSILRFYCYWAVLTAGYSNALAIPLHHANLPLSYLYRTTRENITRCLSDHKQNINIGHVTQTIYNVLLASLLLSSDSGHVEWYLYQRSHCDSICSRADNSNSIRPSAALYTPAAAAAAAGVLKGRAMTTCHIKCYSATDATSIVMSRDHSMAL